MQIHDYFEAERGCGFRKPGGLYLVGGKLGAPCGKLPLRLEVCPCCGGGVKPTRSWTWISPAKLFAGVLCQAVPGRPQMRPMTIRSDPQSWGACLCPLSPHPERAGLLWIGGKFYPTAADFQREAAEMGISRRISAIPKGFQAGETWVCLAHRELIPATIFDDADGVPLDEPLEVKLPGIFAIFKPEHIEYVVNGDESEEELQRKVDRGITLVRVHRKNHLFEGETCAQSVPS